MPKALRREIGLRAVGQPQFHPAIRAYLVLVRYRGTACGVSGMIAISNAQDGGVLGRVPFTKGLP